MPERTAAKAKDSPGSACESVSRVTLDLSCDTKSCVKQYQNQSITIWINSWAPIA